MHLCAFCVSGFMFPVCPWVHAYAHVKLGGPIAYLAHEVVSVTGGKGGEEGMRVPERICQLHDVSMD